MNPVEDIKEHTFGRTVRRTQRIGEEVEAGELTTETLADPPMEEALKLTSTGLKVEVSMDQGALAEEVTTQEEDSPEEEESNHRNNTINITHLLRIKATTALLEPIRLVVTMIGTVNPMKFITIIIIQEVMIIINSDNQQTGVSLSWPSDRQLQQIQRNWSS